jgi:hypothetical protein
LTLQSTVLSAVNQGQGFDVVRGEKANMSAEGWLLYTYGGYLCRAGEYNKWEGQLQEDEIKRGDVLGLLLDVGTPQRYAA